ncbi:MAG: AAA family ATPase, partial [Chloroflexi bacterium]|nr:AAA family ATPase [Chloroflexota bacterium]
MPSIQFFFLGLTRIIRDAQPVAAPTAKAMALLAYLAMTRTSQLRDQLMALLWPESSAEAARKNMRNTLWHIRKITGEGILQTDDDRLSLSADVWVDASAFEQLASGGAPANGKSVPVESLQAAVDLYTGPFLHDLKLSDAPEFEIWVASEQERLGQLYLHTMATLIHARQMAGDWRQVITLARQALAYDNLQEPIHRALMEAHARLDERPEALRQYEILQTTLEHELGVEPMPETENLRLAISNGDIPRTDLSAPARERPPRSVNTTVAAAPFVGRQTERAILDTAYREAMAGLARVVFLTGEIGIGKTRLWEEWSAGLPAEHAILESHCLEAIQALPFMPLIELLSSKLCLQHLAANSPGQGTAQGSKIPPIWLAEIARLIPEIRVYRPDLPATGELPPEEERSRFFEAFTQFFMALETWPLVFFLDDLHWADRATLDWLGYMVRRLRHRPFLLVATYRQEDAPVDLVRLAASLGREGLARRIPLDRLTNEEAAMLITFFHIDPAVAHTIQVQSAGNPYFLIELCRGNPGDAPLELTDLI